MSQSARTDDQIRHHQDRPRRHVSRFGTVSTALLIGGLVLGLPLVGGASSALAGSPSTRADAGTKAACAPWMDTTLAPSVRADRLVAHMTEGQKMHMVTFSEPGSFTYYGTAGHVTGIPALCIPDLVMSDAGSGVAGLQRGTTTFPSGLAQAATWNPAMQQKVGRTIGAEAFAKGINVMLGPGMNIARTPYNGRNFEYLGEDPYLASRTAVSVIRGIQSNPVLADAKHFAFNDQETNRNTVDVRVDERTRRELYLRPFEAAVRQGRVGSIMCSYNLVDTLHACADKQLLTDYLRKDWGFQGFVVSDWGAVHSTAPSANAGLDLEMFIADAPLPGTPITGATNGKYFDPRDLRAAMATGALKQARIDDMVRNIFRPMFRLGLFDHPVKPGLPAYSSDVSTPHLDVARRAAVDATVLLKNDDHQLPLPRTGGHTIAVIGYAAGPIGTNNSVSGGGSSHTLLPGRVVSPLEGIRAQAHEYGDTVVYVDGSSTVDAIAAAKAADYAVVVATDANTEGNDRTDLGLHPSVCVALVCQNQPVDETALVDAVTKANPHNVVVLDIGAPVKMPWLAQARSVLVPWYAGLQHGNALADVLYGRAEPGGRLPQTFPVSEQQIKVPAAQYPGVDGIVDYSEKLDVGYRWYDATHQTPLFPFGFGLGYTTMKLSHLKVRQVDHTAVVTLRVTNTGNRYGNAVPQVYVGFPRSDGEPPRQLKGFTKLRLSAGASRTVRIRLDDRAFAHWSQARHGWVVTPGAYRIYAGTSSRDLPLTRAIRVARAVLPR